MERIADADRVAIDVGAGDGAFTYRAARACPEGFFLAIDANGAAMADRSRRAAAKPARGGAANALFVRASVEALPDALDGVASHVTVLFPWGSLLRAVALPDPDVLRGLARICRPGAHVEVVFAELLPREQAAATAAGLGAIDAAQLHHIVAGWAQAGFVCSVRPQTREALGDRLTTWGKRLMLDPARRFFAIEGVRRSQ